MRVCPVSNSFFITPRIGTRFVLLTGKHPVVGQLPRVSFSALPGQSSDRPNLPPHPSAITALFLDRSLVVVHLTGHDQIMTVEILRTMAIASPQSGQATARGLPEVFHVSARSRWIAQIFEWCDHASDRSEVFRLQVECNLVQANDVTWPAVAWVYASQ